MALLSQGLKDKELDIRMVQRGLTKGLLRTDDIEKHNKKLPDDAENAEYTNLETMMEVLGGKSGLR